MAASRSLLRPTLCVAALVALSVLAACTRTPPVAPRETLTNAQPSPPARTAAPAPPIDDDPTRLLGLDAASLATLLGTPVRVRRDGTVEIQQFRAGDTCQIDAFLYREAGTARVTHYEIRRDLHRLDPPDARNCLRTMLLNKRATS